MIFPACQSSASNTVQEFIEHRIGFFCILPTIVYQNTHFKIKKK